MRILVLGTLCDVSSIYGIYTFPFYLSVHFIYDLRGNDLQSRNTNFIPLVFSISKQFSSTVPPPPEINGKVRNAPKMRSDRF